MNREELLDKLRDLRAGPLPDTPDCLLEHGFHRDSDDPDTWRANVDPRTPRNTEGPGLSFDEAVAAAEAIGVVPPLAVSAEARAIRKVLRAMDGSEFDDFPTLEDSRAASSALDALLARVAEAERAEESLAFAKDTAHDERDARLRAEAEAERLRAALQKIAAERFTWSEVDFEEAQEVARAALRGGDTG